MMRHWRILGVAIALVAATILIPVWNGNRYWVPQGKFPPMTRLMIAASNGDSLKVSEYIAAGRDPDEPTSLGKTAIFFAINNGHFDVARDLLNEGARVELGDIDESIMIASICRLGDIVFLREIFNHVEPGGECSRVAEAFVNQCDVPSLEILLDALGTDREVVLDIVNSASQRDINCAEELQLIVAKYR